MSDLAICDHFKWTLEDIYSLTVKEYLVVIKYMKKLEAEHKSAMRKAKRKGKK